MANYPQIIPVTPSYLEHWITFQKLKCLKWCTDATFRVLGPFIFLEINGNSTLKQVSIFRN